MVPSLHDLLCCRSELPFFEIKLRRWPFPPLTSIDHRAAQCQGLAHKIPHNKKLMVVLLTHTRRVQAAITRALHGEGTVRFVAEHPELAQAVKVRGAGMGGEGWTG